MSNSIEGNTNTIIQEVLETRDLNRLYTLQIECSQDLTILFSRKENAQTTQEQSDAMGKIKVMQSVIDVILNRIPDLKTELGDERIKNISANHKFKLAAKALLKPETYKAIIAESNKFAREIRETTNNKIE